MELTETEKEKIKKIYNRLLDDALIDEPKERVYKTSDYQMLAVINTIGEYFLPKQVRTSVDASRSNLEKIIVEILKPVDENTDSK